jgi:hypothetical protein
MRALIATYCVLVSAVQADTAPARCDLYKIGDDHAYATVACTFSQRQGSVGIQIAGGKRYDLTPTGDQPGNYTDADGHPAYRNNDLGDTGVVFRLHDVNIFLYWDMQVVDSEFDATTSFRCTRASGESAYCAAGILRMDDGQASIIITDPDGKQFTVNFMTDYVNSAGHEVNAELVDDMWTIVVDEKVTYAIPRAAIEGG